MIFKEVEILISLISIVDWVDLFQLDEFIERVKYSASKGEFSHVKPNLETVIRKQVRKNWIWDHNRMLMIYYFSGNEA